MTTSSSARSGPAPGSSATSAQAARRHASSMRTGLLAGAGAYLAWGFFPLYFPLLEPASALEILAHRIVWSFVLCVGLVLATQCWHKVRAVLADRRQLGLLVAASILISVNWGVYIWAVNADQVVETALGYFINPLVSVLMGVLLLRERMRRLQWVAFAVASLAVAVLTVAYGRLPWIALVLALSFGSYGLCKKLAGVESVPSLAVETAVTFPLAVGFLVFLQLQGTLVFTHSSTGNTLLLLGCGVITVAPLLAFNAAATRIPLSVLGLLQYLTPILQFILGITVFGEHMPPARWAGFVIVWIALAIFTVDGVQHSRRVAALAAAG
jgi:chloramphenicol-sensitive protein RarD